MLRYVIRTRESVISRHALPQNLFSADEYIRQKRSRSILCLPLIIVKPGDRARETGPRAWRALSRKQSRLSRIHPGANAVLKGFGVARSPSHWTTLTCMRI